MIMKQRDDMPATKDRRRAAGQAAERQMAFYLHRAFEKDTDFVVLNDIRIVDDAEREDDGKPRTFQIDHLILHRFGAFIVESKSVSNKVKIKEDGSGDDVWTRWYGKTSQGIPSPIKQTERQANALREYLQRHRTSLVGAFEGPIALIAKLRNGSTQRGFQNMPIQIIVAISDGGKIEPENWKGPSEPFQTFVTKADSVESKIRREFKRHFENSKILSKMDDGDYGKWSMKKPEVRSVGRFLADRHTPAANTRVGTPRASEEVPTSSTTAATHSPQKSPDYKPACKACASNELDARWGRFGYYWSCAKCDTNTPMPDTCSACGAKGQRGKGVRISKAGETFTRHCESCGIDQIIWRIG